MGDDRQALTVGPSVEARIRDAVAAPLDRDDRIDLHTELESVLAGVGLSPHDAGGTIAFTGADPIVPSVLPTASAAAIALVAKSVAVAAVWQDRVGVGQDIAMDLRVAPHRLCPFYDRRWELLNGHPPGNVVDTETCLRHTRFWRTRDDRRVLIQGVYPRLRRDALRLLRTWDDPDAVAAAVRRWDAADLEEAAAAAGVVAATVRSPQEFLAEPHCRDALRLAPLVEVERIGPGEPEPWAPAPAQPLSGVRALGFAHVIAGSGIGRTLALHGADALNVFPPRAHESPVPFHSAHYGVRSCRLGLAGGEDRRTFEALLRTADVVFTNRRPALLARLGLGADQLAAIRPGLVHVSVSCHGHSGPWAARAGFDQTAGAVVGMFALEGSMENPRLPVVTVVNDWIVPWLATAGVVAALRRRAVEGGSYRVHLSLTRVAMWILSLGIFDREYAEQTAGTGELHAYLPPETFVEDGPMGRYQGVTDQVWMSATPGRHRVGLTPLGSSRPEWLADG